MNPVRQLFIELRRRKVLRAAGLYVVGAWVTVQVASLVFPAIDVADSAIRYVWLAMFFLMPLVLVFAWLYELTPNGLVRTPPAQAADDADVALRRTDIAILGALLVVAVALILELGSSVRQSGSDNSPSVATASIDPNSIAVLPLENLSEDPEQQYFVSGMQDALISALSRISALKVTSKTSTLRFGNTREALPGIAAQLGVARLIEGSVFRVGERVRITVKLIDAGADVQVWSDSFEVNIADVLSMQSKVAQEIARQVEVSVSPGENARLNSAKKVHPAAYEAFLKGQFHVERFTPQDMALAARYFQQAIELDPDYALAYWGLSKLCAFQAQAGVISPETARERCLPLIERSLELDDSLPEGYAGLAGNLTWQQFNWAEADVAFARAIELNPSYAEAHLFYAHYLTLVGRTEEGKNHMRLALELDPLNPFVRGLYGAQLMMMADYEGAIRVIEEVMASTPGFGFGYIITWRGYFELGDYDKAIAAAANHFRVTRGDPTGALALEEAYADGDFRVAVLHAADVLVEHSKRANVPPVNIGFLYEQGGEIEKAIDWFEIAFQKRDPDAPYMGVIPKSPLVRKNPRYIRLLREMKLDYWADKYARMT